MPADSTGYGTNRQAEETQRIGTSDLVPIDKVPEPGHVHQIQLGIRLQ